MAELKPCKCGGKVRVEYACGEYFISCENGCMDIPPCFHSSEKATAEEWNRSTLADHLITNGVRLETEKSDKTSDEKTSEWIPVSERLPENLVDVLVWYEYFAYGERNRMVKAYGIGCYLTGCGVWSGDPGHGSKVKVTHWMPLPEPPKGE